MALVLEQEQEQEQDRGKQANVEVLTNLCDKITIEDEEETRLVVEQDVNEVA